MIILSVISEAVQEGIRNFYILNQNVINDIVSLLPVIIVFGATTYKTVPNTIAALRSH